MPWNEPKPHNQSLAAKNLHFPPENDLVFRHCDRCRFSVPTETETAHIAVRNYPLNEISEIKMQLSKSQIELMLNLQISMNQKVNLDWLSVAFCVPSF
jgi:hypothetical protein